MAQPDSNRFLVLENVKAYFPVTRGLILKRTVGEVRAVDDVSLTIRKGEILGLVGESGCGKTTLSRAIMQLQRVSAGRIFLEGRELTALSDPAVRAQRINFQMIFQDPYASLNPRMTVSEALGEAIRTRHQYPRRRLIGAVGELMETVGLSAFQMRKYPHEFSGGQRQRIAIARALAPEPKLIVADEPVSALDVSIQSQILNLLTRLARERDLTMLFISHDLSVVKYIADRIAVMYLGRLLELGPSEKVMAAPAHPYTRALISAIPVPDPDVEQMRRRIVLQGDPPSPFYSINDPRTPAPLLQEVSPGHFAADPEAFLAARRSVTV